MSVSVLSATPDAEKILMKAARVSSETPDSEKPGLIGYLIKNKHWSPFEMVNICFEIETTRDIARQLLRHRTIAFQEFSQRYQTIDKLQIEAVLREGRRQHANNRQDSTPDLDTETQIWWIQKQLELWEIIQAIYSEALKKGIAKECVRAILPEGLTKTKLYANMNLRTLIHYVQLRTSNGTQKEHKDLANQMYLLMSEHFPYTFKAISASLPCE